MIYRRSKRAHKRAGTAHSKLKMNIDFRRYKQLLKIDKRGNVSRFNKSLREMHKARPREFWKIFKRSTGEKVCKASLNDLFEFYKNLNQNPGDANPQNLHEAGDFFNLEIHTLA